jgi:hypothetical protein
MNPDDAIISRLRAAAFIAPPVNAPMAVHYKTWNGWDIFETEDTDSDGGLLVKYFAVNQDTGEQRDIDVSPYYPDWRLICRVVDLGCPRRIGPSPLTHADCDRIEASMKEAVK